MKRIKAMVPHNKLWGIKILQISICSVMGYILWKT